MANELPNLGSIITSPVARKTIYGVYAVAVFIAGCFAAGYAVTQTGNPEWLTVANSVLLYAGVPVGALAAANAPSSAQVQIIEALPFPTENRAVIVDPVLDQE